MSARARSRSGQAFLLTLAAGGIVAAMGLALGSGAVVATALTLPVALFLLWLSADVYRADE